MAKVLLMLSEGRTVAAAVASEAKTAAEAKSISDRQEMEAKLKGFSQKLGTIGSTVSSMETRITALEGGAPRATSVGKGEPPMCVHMSQRGASDPMQQAGGDPWAAYHGGRGGTEASGYQWVGYRGEPQWNLATRTPTQAYSSNLEHRVGDRKTLILGGFPRDPTRSDIEETLIEGYEGVEKVSSMGKYAICGRVYLNNTDVMWDIIKANKRKVRA